jgi:hypothetical protein
MIALALAAEAPPAPTLPLSVSAPADVAQAATVSDDELESMSGGANTVTTILTTEQSLTAMNSGNSVSGQTVGSGAITIGTDAFSGFSGIGNFVVNTGHNNNLQGSLSVQVTVLPPPGT